MNRDNHKRLILAFTVPSLMSIPALCGYLSTLGTDRVFLGFIRPDDFHRYGSFIKQAALNFSIFFNEFSCVQGDAKRIPALFFSFLGCISRITCLPDIMLWIGMRTLVGAALLLALWKLSTSIFNRKQSMLIFLFVTFSGGIQWLTWLISCYWNIPFSLPRSRQWWMDGMSTFELMHNPLKIAGMLGLVLFLISALEFRRHGGISKAVIMILLILLAWLIHPMTASVGIGCLLIIPLLSLLRRPALQNLFREISWLSLLTIPLLICIAIVKWMQLDPSSAHTISAHKLVMGPLPIYCYLIHYGVLVPLGIIGLWKLWRQQQKGWELLTAWLLSSLLAQHNPWVEPLLFQHTLHIPLCIVAALGLHSLLKQYSQKKLLRLSFISTVVGLFAIQMIFDVAAVSVQTVQDVWPSSLYMSINDREICRNLMLMPDGNVLSSKDTGNKIAWLSQKRVLLGHWGTTPERHQKQLDVKAFFDPEKSVQMKNDILNQYKITYVFFGSNEKNMGTLDARLNLKEIAHSGDSTLYKIVTL